jgi:hypothetical protein
MALLQADRLTDSRVYLDGCSTVSAFKSKRHLKNIHTVSRIKINCNSGAVITDQQGKYGFINAWFIPDGITSILSMNKLKKKNMNTYDNWDGYYVVHRLNKLVRFYKDDENGLTYINLDESSKEATALLVQTSSEEAATAMVQTVRGNYEEYTKKEVPQPKEVRQALGMIGNPSKGDFKGIMRKNMIKNCPVTTDPITNAPTIFGPDLASIRGKKFCKMPKPVLLDYVAEPRSIVDKNKVVTMGVDVFFVDDIVFLLMVLKQIKFITVEHVATCRAKSLSKH